MVHWSMLRPTQLSKLSIDEKTTFGNIRSRYASTSNTEREGMYKTLKSWQDDGKLGTNVTLPTLKSSPTGGKRKTRTRRGKKRGTRRH